MKKSIFCAVITLSLVYSGGVSETYSGPCQTFKTWRLAKIFAKSRLTIFTKRSALMFDRVLTITSQLLIVAIHLRILMILIQFSVFLQMPINTAQKMKFSIKDFSSKCGQIRRKLRIWSHLLEKSLMENFIFCAVKIFIKYRSKHFLGNLILPRL